MNNDEIKSIALENGFTLRAQPDDSIDLNPYVYHFAKAMYRKGRSARMAEIRPLVADLKLASEYDHRDSIGQQVSERLKHADAVKRLRELVRENSEK